MTAYQLFLLGVLILWPLLIMGLLFFMSRLESYVARSEADTPEEAGLEPVAGRVADREVKIVFGDHVVSPPTADPQPIGPRMAGHEVAAEQAVGEHQ
jgi:hypothetical protein